MKHHWLVIVFFILIGYHAQAQNVEMSFGDQKEWKSGYTITSFLQPYDNGFLVTASQRLSENVIKKYLLHIDEEMRITRQLEVRPSWKYGQSSSLLGDYYHIDGDTLTCLYCIYSGLYKKMGDRFFVQRVVYDLKNMEMVRSEELVGGQFLNNEKKRSNLMRDFDHINAKWTDDYVLLEFSMKNWFPRCFNFIIYDKNFNPIAEKRLIDTFMIKDAVPQDQRREYYYYDYLFSNQGELLYVSTKHKMFELSTGSDIALFSLSKEGYKEYVFDKPLENYNLDNISILKYENSKVWLYGLFAKPQISENYTFDGCCTLEFDMENGEFKILDWKEFDKPLVGTQKPDGFTEHIIRCTSNIYERTNQFERFKIESDAGWCMLWPTEIYQFIDKEGKFQEIRHNNETAIDYLNNYAFLCNNKKLLYYHKTDEKIYYIDMIERNNEKLHWIDNKGDFSSIDLPDDYFCFYDKKQKDPEYRTVYLNDTILIQQHMKLFQFNSKEHYRFGTHNLKTICK